MTYSRSLFLCFVFLPAVIPLATEYCSSPPPLDHGRPVRGGQGILGYPVGSFAFYECNPYYQSKDSIELYRSCEFNGERAIWSDPSSECIFASISKRSNPQKYLPGNTVLTAEGYEPRRDEAEQNKEGENDEKLEDKIADENAKDDASDEELQKDNDVEEAADSQKDFPLNAGCPPGMDCSGRMFPEQVSYPTGLSIYPAIPFSQHYLSAYVKVPDRRPASPGSSVQNVDPRDNGPMWNIPVGPHYSPEALTARNRKIFIKIKPDLSRQEQYQGQQSYQTQRTPLMPMDNSWSPFRPMPNPALSKYSYGCGMAPVVPNAKPAKRLQTRYSIGSTMTYKCQGGKVRNTPDPLSTTCIFDDGTAHWTPIEGSCIEDFDIEFPEDGQQLGENDAASDAGDVIGDDASGSPANDEETEQDRIILSKTLYMQPPAFPNPPWRRGTSPTPVPPTNKRKQRNLCPVNDVLPPTGSCRKPPSERDMAIRSILMGKGASGFENEFANKDDVEPANDLGSGYNRIKYGGIKNPEQIQPPVIQPPTFPYHRVNENLLQNALFDMPEPAITKGMRDPVLEAFFPEPLMPLVDKVPEEDQELEDEAQVKGSEQEHAPESDERLCIGDECTEAPGPDAIEPYQSLTYEIPKSEVKNGKVALNIFHGGDRRKFLGEGVIRSMGDTGFPFNEMYHQNSRRMENGNKKKLSSAKKFYALSEGLMRGGVHGELGPHPPPDKTKLYAGLAVGVAGVAVLLYGLCRCFLKCSLANLGGLIQCEDEGEEEGGGGISDLIGDDDDEGDGFYSRKVSGKRRFKNDARKQWRSAKDYEFMEHSDGN